jgi:hypothetical protein
MTLIKEYGELWARNDKNIAAIAKKRRSGVYVLYDGSMPVYIGKGSNIHRRISRARRSTRRGEFWDHFSWYVITDPDLRHDVEALFLRTLPWYVRALTNQSGKFRDRKKSVEQPSKTPDAIRRRRQSNRRSA